jgi:hypothetical protein
MSGDDAFAAARNADLGQFLDYERQPSPAGEEETFAESAASFSTGRDANMPHLQAFWASFSGQLDDESELTVKLSAERRRTLTDDAPGETIGTASISARGHYHAAASRHR